MGSSAAGSCDTVRTHLQNTFGKLHVGSRPEAAAIAHRAGLRARALRSDDGVLA